MYALFNNLYIYEIVLLFLGVFLFMILSGSFIYYIIKGKEIKKLLFFFMIPIVMIGYPSIQEIQIEKDKIAIVKYKEQIRENPNDSTAIAKTEELIKKLESRATNPEDIAKISEAYLLIEKPEKAIAFADKALEKEENNSTEKKKIDQKKRINTLMEYKKIANFQKDLKANKISIKDTFQIKKRLNNFTVINGKTQQYLNKKYFPKKGIN